MLFVKVAMFDMVSDVKGETPVALLVRFVVAPEIMPDMKVAIL